MTGSASISGSRAILDRLAVSADGRLPHLSYHVDQCGPGTVRSRAEGRGELPRLGHPLAAQAEGPRHVRERNVTEILVLPAAAEVDPAIPANPSEGAVVQHHDGDRQPVLDERGELTDRVPERPVPRQHHGPAARPCRGCTDGGRQRIPPAGLAAGGAHPAAWGGLVGGG